MLSLQETDGDEALEGQFGYRVIIGQAVRESCMCMRRQRYSQWNPGHRSTGKMDQKMQQSSFSRGFTWRLH